MTQQKQKNNKEIEEKKPLYTPIKYILTSVIDCTQNSNVENNTQKNDGFFYEKDEFDYIFLCCLFYYYAKEAFCSIYSFWFHRSCG